MAIPYTGKSEYCYVNSLHMCLVQASANARELPEVGFLECLTTLPFGALYLRLAAGPVCFLSSAAVNPDTGLDRALDALGWTCARWHGRDDGDRDEALQRLRATVQTGPALVGPVDLGYLTYDPHAAALRGGDHFVVALAVEDEEVVLHDPYGYPYARLRVPEFLEAWRAERIDYRRGPYTLRTGFQRVAAVTRAEAIARTLPLLHDTASADPGGPVAYGTLQALRLLAADLRGAPPPGLASDLMSFVLPLTARRRLDAALFLAEADNAEAAQLLDRQARLAGAAQYHAVRGAWWRVAELMDEFTEAESRLIPLL